MTGVEDELRDVDSMIRQPDTGLTRERLQADELARRGYALMRHREALSWIEGQDPQIVDAAREKFNLTDEPLPDSAGQRALLIECMAAMSEATRRYRTSRGLPGNSTEVPGWVAWLDRMQVKVSAELKAGVQR